MERGVSTAWRDLQAAANERCDAQPAVVSLPPQLAQGILGELDGEAFHPFIRVTQS